MFTIKPLINVLNALCDSISSETAIKKVHRSKQILRRIYNDQIGLTSRNQEVGTKLNLHVEISGAARQHVTVNTNVRIIISPIIFQFHVNFILFSGTMRVKILAHSA